jgi:transcriptional regulator with XRE-family HTH domain
MNQGEQNLEHTGRAAAGRKTYHSVSEMVRDLSEDKEFAEDADRSIRERNLVAHLMALRASQEKSQKDIAQAMGCTQSRVSKLENGKDNDLRIGDFHLYADALGLEMMIVLAKKNRTIADEIKFHALSMKRLLDRLTKLAETDKTIARGVESFIAGEAYYNITKMLLEAAAKARKSAKSVPPRKNGAVPSIQIEIQDDESEQEPDGCNAAVCG